MTKKNKFHFFLLNFWAWKKNPGVENTTLIRDNMRSPIRRKYLRNRVFYQQLKIWKWFYNSRKPISFLSYPTHGNQSGAYIDNIFVGPGSFFNEIYGSILSGILNEKARPIVADLGAGYGKLAYFTMRGFRNSCFIDFDLPEVLCLASYYLMKTWPNKSALLYGEGDYSADAHDFYDLIFMPAFEIPKVDEYSVDLFINKNSLGEMTSEAAINFIKFITRSTNYFFHMNHEIYPEIYSDTTRGLLGHEYPIPMDEFRLLIRYPDMGHMLHQGEVDYSMDIFLYLYERIKKSDIINKREISKWI
jgi:hypothetical protein